MADYGIKVSRPGKSVTSDLNNYEFQVVSTKDATREKSSGVATEAVAHGITGGIPMVMRFRVVDSNTVQASADAVVDGTNFTPAFGYNCFYRIFYNKQTEA